MTCSRRRTRAAAAVAVGLLIAGCGDKATAPEPAHQAAAPAPVAAVASTAEPKLGEVRDRTFGVAPSDAASGRLAAPASQRVPQPITAAALERARRRTPSSTSRRSARPPRTRFARFRKSQLAALRALCAPAPPDPRCNGARVDERVAFAGMRESSR